MSKSFRKSSDWDDEVDYEEIQRVNEANSRRAKKKRTRTFEELEKKDDEE
jgi:hypothetical protein